MLPFDSKPILSTILMLGIPITWIGASGQTLRAEAHRAGILVGTAVRAAQLSEPAYADALAREFNLLEPEDALKWEVVHPERHRFDFADGDRIVSFARLHGMKVRGHTLVWTHQNPPWLTQGRFTEKDLFSILHEHISKVVTHYRDRVFAWDVVNEAVDESGMLRGSIWYDQPGIGFSGQGTAYIEQALRWAHEADPGALLFINDAGGEALNAKADALYELATSLKKRGVPLDGIGLQMHLDLNADVGSIARNIQRLTSLGLQVHITEADLGITVDERRRVVRESDLEKQASIYKAVVDACLAQRGCTAFQTWGFTDKYSWINSSSHGKKGAALLFDSQYRPKLAYESVRKSIAEFHKSRP